MTENLPRHLRHDFALDGRFDRGSIWESVVTKRTVITEWFEFASVDDGGSKRFKFDSVMSNMNSKWF